MKGFLLALLLVGAAFCDESTRHPEDNLITTTTAAKSSDAAEEVKIALPDPVDISTAVNVGAKPSAEEASVRVEIDQDGIPVVHGVVMPDDPSDTKTWRNARVLNNVLVEKQQQQRDAADHGDMFVYRPELARVLNDDGFKPSQADTSASQSLPYPAFYYQRFYNDKESKQQELPDSLAVESDSDSAGSPSEDETVQQQAASEDETAQPQVAFEEGTDGRGFNAKKTKKTGITKLAPGSSYGNGAYAGRPITNYYVQSEDAKSIHDDRSPYEYEPAQQQPSSYYTSDYTAQQTSASKQDNAAIQYYQQQLLQLQQKQQQQATDSPNRAGLYQQNSFLTGNVIPAPADSFVIRDQTYTSGGQTFSVPIPIPKQDQYQQQQQQQPQYQYGQYTQYPQYQYAYQQQQQYGGQQQYYQQQQRPAQQPFEFLGLKFKEQVQKAKDKFHDMTDPVVDPLMEAGQKISTNLGLPERVVKINEKVATPSVLVPLAMAGGAALALGGLSTAIHLSNPETKNSVFKLLRVENSTLAERVQMALNPMRQQAAVSKAKRSVDDDEGSNFSTGVAADDIDNEKENLLEHVLSALNGPQKAFLTQLQRTGFDQWQKTPCAKRIFCDVMVQQNGDAIVLMEKRMATFLTLLDSGVAQNLQALTSDVMDGIRRRNCRAFVCGAEEVQQQ